MNIILYQPQPPDNHIVGQLYYHVMHQEIIHGVILRISIYLSWSLNSTTQNQSVLSFAYDAGNMLFANLCF